MPQRTAAVGSKGNVLDAIRENELDADSHLCVRSDTDAAGTETHMRLKTIWNRWISMEEKMACGIGACLACVCQSKEVDGHTNVHNKRDLQGRSGISSRGGRDCDEY